MKNKNICILWFNVLKKLLLDLYYEIEFLILG